MSGKRNSQKAIGITIKLHLLKSESKFIVIIEILLIILRCKLIPECFHSGSVESGPTYRNLTGISYISALNEYFVIVNCAVRQVPGSINCLIVVQ